MIKDRGVLFDGLNLRLRSGTGIATYTRSTMQAAASSGYSTGVIHSCKAASSGDSVLATATFLQELYSPAPLRSLSKWDWAWRIFFDRKGITANALELHPSVPLDDFEHVFPRSDCLVFAVEDLFRRAGVYFEQTGRMLEVSVPSQFGISHWTYPLPIRVKGAAMVQTIHDIIPLLLPHTTRDDKAKFYSLLRGVCKDSDLILTVSEKSRVDLVQILGVPEERVVNLYQTVDVSDIEASEPIEKSEQFINSIFGVPAKGFFLFFGAAEPKKNLDRLVQGYLLSGSEYPLLIAGARGWDQSDNLQDPFNCGVIGRIRRIGFLPRPILMRLARCARATLFPSLYEGFGLPVLESMALGVATLTSNRGAMPETTNGLSVLVDPYSVESISDGIKSLSCDEHLLAYLGESGRIYCRKNFSAEAFALRLRSTYASLGS